MKQQIVEITEKQQVIWSAERQQIVEIAESYWTERVPVLLKVVEDGARQIENIVSLEDYYRNARTEEVGLQRSFGGFASATLDFKALSSVLQQGHDSRTMQKERYRRILAVARDLDKLRDSYRENPPACRFVELEQGAQAIFSAFENHIEGVARAFGLLRRARLEARGKYVPAEHDVFFEGFNWRQLDNSEMELCPPFVVFSTREEHFSAYLGKLLELVTSGKPLKIFVLRPSFFTGVAETGRAAALRSASDIELLFLSLRNVYFLQTSTAGPSGLAAPISRGLRSPRPAVFSILTDSAHTDGFQGRASQALLSRAFPHFVYDPDRASDFVSCLDLGENTAPEEMWPKTSLEYVSADGKTQHLERPFTFADFAVNEKEFQDQFSPLPANVAESALVSLADYLGMTPAGRVGKTPFILHRSQEKHLVKLVPSQVMIAQTADKLHLWHTLQELGGIKNPFVQAAEQRLKEELTAEREKSLNEQKAQLEAQLKARESEAVAAAMRNLALRLTGMSTAAPEMTVPAPAVQVPAKAPPEAPAAVPTPAAAPVSELPWIEEKLCTTCDECTTINKKIFAYNGSKKAYILDPKGGPYRDIVRAAEKCSSGAIHPGLPQDPSEKDLEKLIKRAEKFQ
jgi:pyruvate-ferredoxin/flavodoxin oxidoreductase